MLKNIPIPANHYIDGYKEVITFNPNNIFADSVILYKPIYKRSLSFGSIVTTDTTPYLLVDDTYGLNAMNELCEIKDYKIANDSQVDEFVELLNKNGFDLRDGKIVKQITYYYRPTYTVDNGFVPMRITADKASYERFSKWNEVFDTIEECANWCNHINKTLNRGYKEL